MSLKTALSRTKALLTPRASTTSIPQSPDPPPRGRDHDFHRAPTETSLFPPVVVHASANDDGGEEEEADCDHECGTCEIAYPKGFKIDETKRLYGRVNGWGVHLLVATGRSDWVRDVADEKGSLMEAVRDVGAAKKKKEKKKGDGDGEGGKRGNEEEEGGERLMVSASNMPVPEEVGQAGETRVLLLPSWTMVGRVTPGRVGELIERVVESGATNTTLLKIGGGSREVVQPQQEEGDEVMAAQDAADVTTTKKRNPTRSANEEEQPKLGNGPTLQQQQQLQTAESATAISPSPSFDTRPCPHNYLILLCSHRTRDARCGQSAPLLRKEFERQLRPLGLYRDLLDERPGGVGIYFINHVGGHKFSANVMVYRRAAKEDGTMGEASQCIWLARVRPEDCEGIVKFTVLQGKVVKPQRQLRGGFDREKGLVSW